MELGLHSPRAALRWSVAAVLTVAAVGACSGSGSAGGAAAAAKTFTYWSMWNEDEPQAKVLRTAFDEFQKDTGITVNVVWQDRKVVAKTVDAINAHDPVPDLVDQSDGILDAGLARPGWATDLSSVYTMPIPGENQQVQDVIPDKYMPELSDANGTPFIVPYEVAGEAIFFDKSKHPEIADNKPRTWDDFMALLKELKAKTGTGPIALDSVAPEYDAYWLDWPLERKLGPIALQAIAKDRTGTAWDDPSILETAKKVEALVKGGYFAAGYNTETDPSHYRVQENRWAKGGAAVILGGTWTPSETAESGMKPEDVDSFQFPQIDGGDQSASVVFFGFAVPKQAKHPDAAKKFMAYFLNKSRLSHISTDAANMTPRTDIPAPISLKAEQTALIVRTVFTDQAGYSKELAPWFTGVFEPACVKLVRGQETAEQWVAEVKAGTKAYWAKQPGATTP